MGKKNDRENRLKEPKEPAGKTGQTIVLNTKFRWRRLHAALKPRQQSTA